MEQSLRKFGVILAVAILFSIFVFSLADAVIPERSYPDTCTESENYERPYYDYQPRAPNDTCEELAAPTQEQRDACPGNLRAEYENGCPATYVCDCYEITQDYNEQEDTIKFWLAIILGFIAVIVGMLLPNTNPLNEWVGSGFMLGGLITIFIATASYWSNIDKIARPIVILLELALVLWLAYRRFGNAKKKKK